jgi:FkbM family methyltransferase
MTMVSYAQNGEDVLLARLFPKGLKGFYIDVGAHLPVMGSVTKHFYDQGWHGINVEPASEPFAALSEARSRDVNLCVGVSDKPGTLTLFESGGTGCSTFSPDAAGHQRASGIPFVEREVEVLTLAQICEDHVEGEIDFLSIDVEGHEGQVLLGADWKRWRPRVVLVEATEPLTTVSSHDAWEPTLLDADYLFATFDGLNRWYVRIEDSKLLEPLRTPANILDDYIPYVHFKVQEELRYSLELNYKHLIAARAVNQTLAEQYADLLADYEAVEPDMSMLQAEFERLQRSLAGSRARYEEMSGAVEAVRELYEPLCQALVELQARAEDAHSLFEGVSPEALGVARRLGRLAEQHPGAARMVTRPARLAMAVKRKLGGLGAA